MTATTVHRLMDRWENNIVMEQYECQAMSSLEPNTVVNGTMECCILQPFFQKQFTFFMMQGFHQV